MKHLILFSLILLPYLLFSQEDSTLHFNTLIHSVYGDLNKDGLEDLAMVTQDTIHENAPYKLEVFFRQTNNDLKLIVSTTKAIYPQYPDRLSGDDFYQLSIDRGVLWIETEFLRGNEQLKFRYQNGHFEMIGYSFTNVEGQGESIIIDHNLSTGRRIEKEGLISDDTYKTTLNKVVKFNPLPSLEEFNAEDLFPRYYEDPETKMIEIFTINKKYRIGFGETIEDYAYCDAYIIEDGLSTKLKWSETDKVQHCGFTSNFNVSPNGRYVILEKIESGMVDDGKTLENHINYFCWLIDLQTKKIIDQYQSGCGGEWTARNEWVLGEKILFKPE